MSLGISNNTLQNSWAFLNLQSKDASPLLPASSRKRQKLETEHLFSSRLTFPRLPCKLEAGVEGKQRSFKMLTSHLPLSYTQAALRAEYTCSNLEKQTVINTTFIMHNCQCEGLDSKVLPNPMILRKF